MNILTKVVLGVLMGLPLYILYRLHVPDPSFWQATLVGFIAAQFGIIYINS